jgi:hypothetical protein
MFVLRFEVNPVLTDFFSLLDVLYHGVCKGCEGGMRSGAQLRRMLASEAIRRCWQRPEPRLRGGYMYLSP